MTWTVAVLGEPANVPPRARVTVTTTDSTPSATVLRNNPDGSQSRLRTTTGDVLQLPGGTGIVYDYEMPLGQSVTYTVAGQSVTSAAVTVDASTVWLNLPGNPALSQPVSLRVGSFDEDDRAITAGVFEVLGRDDAVVITDGQRKSSQSQLTVGCDTLAQATAVMALLNPGQVLQLNVPPSLGLGIDTVYIHCGAVKLRRPSSVGTDPHRDVVIDFRVVSQPIGGAIQQRSYLDVLATYASYSALAAAPAYSSLL